MITRHRRQIVTDAVSAVLGILLTAFAIYGAFWWDFHCWRLEHPSTPTWVYWARSGR